MEFELTTSTARSDAYLSSDRERDRLATLRSTYVFDASLDDAFKAHVDMARLITGASTSLVSLVAERDQHFKSGSGTTLSGTPRDIFFCTHAVEADEILEVCNAAEEPEFRHNPLVTGSPNIRYYFGVPIRGFNGLPIGTLCVFDDKPRLPLRETERDALRQLAQSVESIIEHGRSIRVREAQLDLAKSGRSEDRIATYQDALRRARAEFKTIERVLADGTDGLAAITTATRRGLDAVSTTQTDAARSPWNVVIETIVESLEDYAAERDVILDFESPDLESPMPPSNAARTLMSLVRSSIDYSARNAKVGVKLSAGPYFVTVSIYREDAGLKVAKPDDPAPSDMATMTDVMTNTRQALVACGGYLEDKPWTGGTVLKAWFPHRSQDKPTGK